MNDVETTLKNIGTKSVLRTKFYRLHGYLFPSHTSEKLIAATVFDQLGKIDFSNQQSAFVHNRNIVTYTTDNALSNDVVTFMKRVEESVHLMT